jgi:hypothetical protein
MTHARKRFEAQTTARATSLRRTDLSFAATSDLPGRGTTCLNDELPVRRLALRRLRLPIAGIEATGCARRVQKTQTEMEPGATATAFSFVPSNEKRETST